MLNYWCHCFLYRSAIGTWDIQQRGFLHYCIFEVKVSGHDSHSLLFGFLDWWTQEVCKRERRNGELDQVGQLWLLRGAHRTTKCQSKPQLSVWWACVCVCVCVCFRRWFTLDLSICNDRTGVVGDGEDGYPQCSAVAQVEMSTLCPCLDQDNAWC